MQDSANDAFFACKDIDVVAIHNYDPTTVEGVRAVLAKARAYGKRVIGEEFSCDGKASGVQVRAACNEAILQAWEDGGVPWMIWSILKPANNLREVFVGDPTWPILAAHASKCIRGTGTKGDPWPEVRCEAV